MRYTGDKGREWVTPLLLILCLLLWGALILGVLEEWL